MRSLLIERILLLQRLRLEDEERRRREAVEQQRKEKLEEEMRKKREAGTVIVVFLQQVFFFLNIDSYRDSNDSSSSFFYIYLYRWHGRLPTAETDQTARSFLFQRALRSETKVVKDMIEATPESSSSLTGGVPRFSTPAATRLVGWEFMTIVEGVGEVSEERGIQETLLHVAVRVGSVDLAVFFVEKGKPNLLCEGINPKSSVGVYPCDAVFIK